MIEGTQLNMTGTGTSRWRKEKPWILRAKGHNNPRWKTFGRFHVTWLERLGFCAHLHRHKENGDLLRGGFNGIRWGRKWRLGATLWPSGGVSSPSTRAGSRGSADHARTRPGSHRRIKMKSVGCCGSGFELGFCLVVFFVWFGLVVTKKLNWGGYSNGTSAYPFYWLDSSVLRFSGSQHLINENLL